MPSSLLLSGDLSMVINYYAGNWLWIPTSLLLAFQCEELCAVPLSLGLGIDFISPAKSLLSMKNLEEKNSHGGGNGESQSNRSSAAAGGVDSYCSAWMKGVSLRVPADYKNEALHCFKLAGPVVRSECSDPVANGSQHCSGNILHL